MRICFGMCMCMCVCVCVFLCIHTIPCTNTVTWKHGMVVAVDIEGLIIIKTRLIAILLELLLH